ncbi:MAG TPA: phosphate ABC transporter permease subunit PstC [Firmicutes bacterium]|nr:phosphate ABC transporter permease subunit PstC [Bacillota bacterium]
MFSIKVSSPFPARGTAPGGRTRWVSRQVGDRVIHVLLLSFAFTCIVFLVGIVIVLLMEGLPVLQKLGIAPFILGRDWYPTYEPPSFGALPLVLGSLWVTLGAIIVAVPLGIGAAIYTSQIAGERTREMIKPIVELLAGIPSVVYGFFGMAVVSPLVQRIFDLPTGLTALTGAITLAIMSLPTVVSISEDAITAVPNSYKEASYALGATKWETISRVVVPAASSGIFTAVILGISRAIGETMTVLMVAGNSAIIPRSFLQPVRTMTATIAAEMGEAPVGSDHYHALFAIGILLFLMTLIFNILADFLTRRYKERMGKV